MILQSFRRFVGSQRRQRRFRQIYDRFRSFTMVPCDTYVGNLRLAENNRHVPGCIVECGVWRGGMIAGLAAVLGRDRQYYLFDSFEGLPPAKQIDGEAALRWQTDTTGATFHDNCAASPQFAQRAMILAEARSFQLVKGWFNETLPTFRPSEPIMLLRLDADWYDSTMTCLENLFAHITPGGIIVLDDYYAWDGCSRALHDFLSRRSAKERIRNLGDICYFHKVT